MKIWLSEKNCKISNKKIVLIFAACIVFVFASMFVIRYIKIYQRKNDPYWQIAKEIYSAEQALKRENEDWVLQSLSKVNSYCYKFENGSTINYYHCVTSYLGQEPTVLDGLNTIALEQVVDIESLKNNRECEVNGLLAIVGEFEGSTYLCWTLTAEDSCVIEYENSDFSVEEIIRMVESIQVP